MHRIIPWLDESFRDNSWLDSSRPQNGQTPTILWPKIFVHHVLIFPTWGHFARRQLNELANAKANLGWASCFLPEFDVEPRVSKDQLHAAFHFGPTSESAITLDDKGFHVVGGATRLFPSRSIKIRVVPNIPFPIVH